MTPGERLYEVKMTVCAHCLHGEGGECHTPGCAFWMASAPDSRLLVDSARFAAGEG